jgi:hypothetical protein
MYEYLYTLLLRMADTKTFQNNGISSWGNLYQEGEEDVNKINPNVGFRTHNWS